MLSPMLTFNVLSCFPRENYSFHMCLHQNNYGRMVSHINFCTNFHCFTRSKSRKELMQISAAVMGIEFSYAAETAFVSPLLLNIGLRHRHMTLIWCLSPLVSKKRYNVELCFMGSIFY